MFAQLYARAGTHKPTSVHTDPHTYFRLQSYDRADEISVFTFVPHHANLVGILLLPPFQLVHPFSIFKEIRMGVGIISCVQQWSQVPHPVPKRVFWVKTPIVAHTKA